MTACAKEADVSQVPKDSDIVVRVGPVSISDGELNRWVAWYRKVDPALSAAKIRRITLTDYLLPRSLARAAAGPERLVTLVARAQAFYTELVNSGDSLSAFRKIAEKQNVGLDDSDDYFPPFNALPMDLSEAVFSIEVGSHTPVIASQLGYCVAAVVDKKNDGIERRKILIARFLYSDAVDAKKTLREASLALQKERAWVHPRYRREFDSVLRNISKDWPPPHSPQKPHSSQKPRPHK